MNKYDDITTFLRTEPSIKADYELVISYINTYLYRNTNREKVDSFYKNIPGIIDKLLVSLKTRNPKLNSRQSSSDVDILDQDSTTFEDFDKLLHIFQPSLESYGYTYKNLFHSINSPPDYTPHYNLPARIASVTVGNLIGMNRVEDVLSLPFFDSIYNTLTQRESLSKGLIHVNLFEYFLLLFLIGIKEYPANYRHKVNLSKTNKFFDDLRKDSSSLNKISLSEKSIQNFNLIKFDKTLVLNFFNILFKDYLDYFAETKYKLRLMVTAVHLIWLSDYYIPLSQSLLDKSFNEHYDYFFKNKNDNFNKLNLFSNDVSPNFGVPNLILLQCLNTLVLTLGKEKFLFREVKNLLRLDRDSFIFIIQKPLFYFLKSCFTKYSSHNSVNLSDVTRVFYSYITPWTSLVDSSAAREYIEANILFYTELFNDYISLFSDLNVLTKEELNLLNDILSLYRISDDLILMNNLSLSILADFSEGKNLPVNIENHIKYIGSNKSQLYPFKQTENKKKAKVIVTNISNWISKLDRNEYSEKSTKDTNDEIKKFIDTLKNQQYTLKSLYKIDVKKIFIYFQTGAEFYDLSESKNLIDETVSHNIHLKKNYSALFWGNPWNRKVSQDENLVLFYFFKYVSYTVDYIRRIPIEFDREGGWSPPVTNLRYFSNYYNFVSTLFFILLFYILTKIILNLI